MKKLNGMTWAHDRGIKPLEAASRIFKEKYGVEITWAARSLSDFELFPLEQLASSYDFIMIDHPHIGIAHENSLLQPLENLLSDGFLADQKRGSVGKSYDSYTWEGHQYALPLDAAAQVGAYRRDLLDQFGQKLPMTWDEVFALAQNLPQGYEIGIPFVPVHAYSSFFTLCWHFSDSGFWSNGEALSYEAGEKALDVLIELLRAACSASKDMDPIDLFEKMSTTDTLVYCPLIYGYSNYARDGYRTHLIEFADMPKHHTSPNGSMIGGVGLAISSGCKMLDEAVRFAEMVADPEFQRTTLFDAGGQPGHIMAWKDESVNLNSHRFFADTLDTLSLGSVRPRFSGYIDFQAEAGKRIRKFVLDGNGNKRQFIDELNQLIKECRENKGLPKMEE